MSSASFVHLSMKDRFSSVAQQYAQYRPQYPQSLYNFLLQHVQHTTKALDVGTGNGQVAAVLADHFSQVYATDISSKQLSYATNKPNIIYQCEPAEQTSFANHTFDLVVCAQAIHWFNVQRFFAEVHRILQPDGLVAIWGYGLITTAGELNIIISTFYHQLKDYWDKERRHIDEAYANIPFPFAAIECPPFTIDVQWTRQQLIGYLSTWSAVKAYIEKHAEDPVQAIATAIYAIWNDESARQFSFPVFMKAGRPRISTS